MTRFEYIYPRVNIQVPSNFIQVPILQNRDILEVYLDGIGMSKIISSGTPVGQEVLYIPSTGLLQFSVSSTNYSKVVVLYQNL